MKKITTILGGLFRYFMFAFIPVVVFLNTIYKFKIIAIEAVLLGSLAVSIVFSIVCLVVEKLIINSKIFRTQVKFYW